MKNKTELIKLCPKCGSDLLVRDCTACGTSCRAHDCYCSACGAKLPETATKETPPDTRPIRIPADYHRNVWSKVKEAWELFNSSLVKFVAICIVITMIDAFFINTYQEKKDEVKKGSSVSIVAGKETDDDHSVSTKTEAKDTTEGNKNKKSRITLILPGKDEIILNNSRELASALLEQTPYVLKVTVFWYFYQLLLFGAYFLSLPAAAGKEPEVRDYFCGFRRFPSIAGLIFLKEALLLFIFFAVLIISFTFFDQLGETLVGVSFIVSLAILIIGSYFTLIRFFLVYPLLADRELSIMDSIKASFRLTSGRNISIIVFMLKAVVLIKITAYMSVFYDAQDVASDFFEKLQGTSKSIEMVGKYVVHFLQRLGNKHDTCFCSMHNICCI